MFRLAETVRRNWEGEGREGEELKVSEHTERSGAERGMGVRQGTQGGADGGAEEDRGGPSGAKGGRAGEDRREEERVRAGEPPGVRAQACEERKRRECGG